LDASARTAEKECARKQAQAREQRSAAQMKGIDGDEVILGALGEAAARPMILAVRPEQLVGVAGQDRIVGNLLFV